MCDLNTDVKEGEADEQLKHRELLNGLEGKQGSEYLPIMPFWNQRRFVPMMHVLFITYQYHWDFHCTGLYKLACCMHITLTFWTHVPGLSLFFPTNIDTYAISYRFELFVTNPPDLSPIDGYVILK